MPEVAKPDDLLTRVQKLQDEQRALAAIQRGRLLAEQSTSVDSTASTTYIDLGPTLTQVRPSSAGRLLVVVSAGLIVSPGDDALVAFRVNGSLMALAADDSWAFRVFNGAANPDAIAVYGAHEAVVVGLADGVYQLTLQMRSVNGGLVTCDGRGISAQPC